MGEGTLLELLKVDAVEKVLSVSRKSTGIKHEGFKRTLGFRPAIMKWAKGHEKSKQRTE